jgi:hypothetical protein
MADNLSSISEAMCKASEAFADAIAAVSKSVQSAAAHSSGADRDRLVEHWLRVARMSKDGMVTAIEHGFEVWERERRGLAGLSGEAAGAPANPMEAWLENLRKATESIAGSAAGAFGEEARKQAESLQKSLAEGIRAWQRLWEPQNK